MVLEPFALDARKKNIKMLQFYFEVSRFSETKEEEKWLAEEKIRIYEISRATLNDKRHQKSLGIADESTQSLFAS